MNIPSLLQFSFVQLILLFLVPLAVSTLLYIRDEDITKKWRWLLTSFRFISIFVVILLLFQWKWFGQQSIIVKPTLAIVVDDSESMAEDSMRVASFLKNDLPKLQDAGYHVDVFNLAQEKIKIDTLQFKRNESALLSSIHKLVSSYENENHLVGVIALSDGIVNSGVSNASNILTSTPIHSFGFGDISAKKDVRVVSFSSNKSALINNSFEIAAQLAATGFVNQRVELVLKKEGKVVQKKDWFISNRSDFLRISFFEKASEKGFVSYQLEINAPADDKNKQNNSKSTVIEIVEGKKKVLILANSPHPDIRMFEAVLASSSQYDVKTHVLSIGSSGANLNKMADETYEWVIAHQLPSSLPASETLLSTFIRKNTPVFFVVGAQTSISQLNKLQKSLQISVTSTRSDKVRGALANGQESLLIDTEMGEMFSDFPPVLSPYGAFQLDPNSQVILEQVVGTVKTNKPLLFVHSSESSPLGFFVGDGLWQWRMGSFQEKGEFAVFDSFWLKMFQLIEKKSESNQLRVIPTKEMFNQGESVELMVETFNVLGEPLSNQLVFLEIQNKTNFKKSFEVTSEVPATSFKQSGLREGMYTYRAEATLNGKKVETSGYFEVTNTNKELEVREADHDLLLTISGTSKGQFVTGDNSSSLIKYLSETIPAGKVVVREEWMDTIDWTSLFVILLVCLSIEWGVRKYIGK